MAFNAGELVATIRLDGVDKFSGDLERSGQQFQTLSNVGRASLDIVAGATTAAAAAATTYLGVLFSTGVAYNQLQQTTRAALSTLLGGAEAANEQMDKLDAFARTSPFSKQVFITAQQQLIGFGMEAKNVIPTLTAVQDAVAATGGSSTQLGEITYVLAQIQAAGKITAQDLMQLGQRGIDAATLIGSQMGKTGSQIREDISNGALSAGDALTALTAGMEAKFAGAAANVKNTFSGTVDRIKAASRDIGSALAEPFVSTSGGGLFVLWGNQVADILRAVQADTIKVVDIMEGRAGPAFAKITESLDSAVIAVKAWDASSLESTLDKLEPYTPIIAGFAAAWSLVGLKAIPVIGGLVGGLSPLTAGLIAMAAASPEVRSALGDVFDALSPLIPVGAKVAGILSDIALDVFADGLSIVATVARPVVDIISEIPTPVLAAVAAFIGFRNVLGPLTEPVAKLVEGFTQIAQRIAVQAALSGMEGAAGTLSGTMGVAAIQIQGVGNALKAAFISNPVGIALVAIAGAVALFVAALSTQQQQSEKSKQAVKDYKASLDAASGAVTTATAEIVKKNLADSYAADRAKALGLSLETVTNAVMGQSGAIQEVNAAMGVYGQSDLAAANGKMSLTAYDLATAMGEQKTAIEAAEKQTKADAEAKREALAALTDAERATNKFNDALAIVNDTARSTAERITALNTAVDLLKGGTMNAEEQAAELNRTVLQVKEAFAQTDEKGNALWQGLINGAGAIDTNSQAGLNLRDTMSASRDKMEEAMLAAKDLAAQQGGDSVKQAEAAAAAGQKYVDALKDQLKAAGLTDEQIQGLIGTYGDVPTVTQALITDDGTIGGTQAQLVALHGVINATPDHTITITEPKSPEIVTALEALGYKIEHLPDGKVRIDGSDVDAINSNLNTTINLLQTALSTKSQGILSQPFRGSSIPGSYDGDLFRGQVKAFADGGISSGIYAGVMGGLHKFAEAEMGVPWEAYISGRPSSRERNQEILARTAELLNMRVVPVGKERAFATGGLLSTTQPQPQTQAPDPTKPGDVWNFTYVKNGDSGITDTQELVQAGQILKTVVRR